MDNLGVIPSTLSYWNSFDDVLSLVMSLVLLPTFLTIDGPKMNQLDRGHGKWKWISESLRDKFCSGQSFENPSDNELLELILLTADCQAYWNNNVVTKLVDEKLGSIGIGLESIIVNKYVRRCFESCIVAIEPTKRSYWRRNISYKTMNTEVHFVILGEQFFSWLPFFSLLHQNTVLSL